MNVPRSYFSLPSDKISNLLCYGLHSDDFNICLQWLCVPFLLLSPTSANIAHTAFNHTFQEPWIGTLEQDKVWKWIDDFLMLVS